MGGSRTHRYHRSLFFAVSFGELCSTMCPKARWAGQPIEMRVDNCDQVFIGGTTLQGAGDHYCPDAFRPLTPLLAACALGNMAINGHKADCLFGKVGGGILNYFKYKITNAVAEGINNKITVLKRRNIEAGRVFCRLPDLVGNSGGTFLLTVPL